MVPGMQVRAAVAAAEMWLQLKCQYNNDRVITFVLQPAVAGAAAARRRWRLQSAVARSDLLCRCTSVHRNSHK